MEMIRMLLAEIGKFDYAGSNSKGWSSLDAWEGTYFTIGWGYGRLRRQPKPRGLVLVHQLNGVNADYEQHPRSPRNPGDGHPCTRTIANKCHQ